MDKDTVKTKISLRFRLPNASNDGEDEPERPSLSVEQTTISVSDPEDSDSKVANISTHSDGLITTLTTDEKPFNKEMIERVTFDDKSQPEGQKQFHSYRYAINKSINGINKPVNGIFGLSTDRRLCPNVTKRCLSSTSVRTVYGQSHRQFIRRTGYSQSASPSGRNITLPEIRPTALSSFQSASLSNIHKNNRSTTKEGLDSGTKTKVAAIQNFVVQKPGEILGNAKRGSLLPNSGYNLTKTHSKNLLCPSLLKDQRNTLLYYNGYNKDGYITSEFTGLSSPYSKTSLCISASTDPAQRETLSCSTKTLHHRPVTSGRQPLMY